MLVVKGVGSLSLMEYPGDGTGDVIFGVESAGFGCPPMGGELASRPVQDLTLFYFVVKCDFWDLGRSVCTLLY